MVPFKIQYLQAGVVAEDKFYISQKKLPQVNQQMLENSLQQYLEQLKQRPQKAPETEKSLIREKTDREGKKNPFSKRQKKEAVQMSGKEERFRGAIEKDTEGHVKHLDIKI